jgi:hypothetical protein
MQLKALRHPTSPGARPSGPAGGRQSPSSSVDPESVQWRSSSTSRSGVGRAGVESSAPRSGCDSAPAEATTSASEHGERQEDLWSSPDLVVEDRSRVGSRLASTGQGIDEDGQRHVTLEFRRSPVRARCPRLGADGALEQSGLAVHFAHHLDGARMPRSRPSGHARAQRVRDRARRGVNASHARPPGRG